MLNLCLWFSFDCESRFVFVGLLKNAIFWKFFDFNELLLNYFCRGCVLIQCIVTNLCRKYAIRLLCLFAFIIKVIVSINQLWYLYVLVIDSVIVVCD